MMKLYYSPTSPFARKVLAVAIECGLDGRIKRHRAMAIGPTSEVAADNPLGKIPCLVTDGGEAIYDSPVICEYLDSLHDGLKLFPPTGGARWTALRRQALADGIMDAAVLRLLEGRRPDERQAQEWIDKQKAAMGNALDALEEEVPSLVGQATIGHITIAAALGYIDFRFADDLWRTARPRLAGWFADFSLRPSIGETVPHD